MPGPPLPGGPVLAGNGKKPLRPSLRSATFPQSEELAAKPA